MFENRKLQKQKLLLEINQYKKANQMMESMPEFAKDEDEDQWKSLSSGKKVYTEQETMDMQTAARNIYYTNPIAAGIVETIINFTIGKKCQMTAEDQDEKVQEYWKEFYKVNKFDEKSKEIVRRTLRDGESFIRFFEPKEKDGVPLIRFVEPEEIKDSSGKHSFGIETNPDDVEEVVNYYREYTDENNIQQTEVIPAEEIIHKKIKVDSNVKRGVSFYTGIAGYITKYKNWLDDRIILNKIRTMFNLIGKPTGTAPSDLASKFSDVSGKTSTGGTAKKRLPKSGSVLLSKGIEWDFKNLQINAGDTKDDGRAILLMIVAGTNLAEFMVTGDASNSSYASTMVSESPAVKSFEAWQDTFEKVYQEIFRWVISYGIEKGTLPNKTEKVTVVFDISKMKEIEKKESTATNTECQIDFPILIHRDLKDETESLQIQRANGWVSSRTASGKLGYDYKEENNRIAQEEVNDIGGEENGEG